MTTVTDAMLKPCPFCGEVELVQPPIKWCGDDTIDPHGDCRCNGCGASGPIRDAAGQRADPIERWNTRTPTNKEPSEADVERVARAIFRCGFEGDWDEAIIEQCWNDASEDERHIPEARASITAMQRDKP